MTRNLYDMISKAICMYDPFISKKEVEKIRETETDNCFKALTLIEKLNDTCQKFFHIGKHLALDESIVPMYNVSTIVQTWKQKLYPKGARFFKVANVFGYALLSVLDCQRTRHEYAKYDQIETKGGKIVLYCLDKLGILNKKYGHVIYMDTYYMSVALAAFLLMNIVYLNGTLRANAADKPDDCDIKNGQPIEQGEYQMWTDEHMDLFFVSMYDTKLFYHLTSVPHQHDDVIDKSEQSKREEAEKNRQEELLDEKLTQFTCSTKSELQKLCQKRRLSENANKDVLIEALLEYEYMQLQNETDIKQTTSTSSSSNDNTNDHTNDNTNDNINDNINDNNNNDNSNSNDNSNANNKSNDKQEIEDFDETEERDRDYMNKITKDLSDILSMNVNELKAQVRLRQIPQRSQYRTKPQLLKKLRDWDGTSDLENVKPRSRSKTQQKSSKKRKKKTDIIPKQVQLYRTNMGGVDRHDRRVIKWSIALTTLRWYIKMFYHIIDVCIANSNILFNIITMMDVDIFEMVSNIRRSRRNIPYSITHFDQCPSKKQMPKHELEPHL